MAEPCIEDPVCFGKALKSGLKYVRDEERKEYRKKMGPWLMVSAVVYMIIIVWAILLAAKAPAANRAVHMTFAILFAPAYVLAFYLGDMADQK
jgi:hypothetical protein